MVDNLTPDISSFPFPSATFLWVWGANSEGELGNFGNVNVDITHPVLNDVFFPAGTQLTSLAAGDDIPPVSKGSHSLAVASSGNLFAWGYDVFGQVGDGHSGTNVLGPVQVCAGGQTAPCTQFLSAIIAAAAGEFHSLALDSVGNVWAWGLNDLGQLGAEIGDASVIPIRNDALFAEVNQHGRPPVTAIAAGDRHSLALDGSNVWVWGSNASGQLGLGNNEPSVTFASPILSLRGLGIKTIAAGGDQSFALDSEQNVWAWGLNDQGQLGISSSDLLRNVPVKLDHFPQLNTRITRIAAGARHTLAIDNRGTVWAWGANESGQLGIGITSHSRAPIRVHFPDGTPRIVMIDAGGAHSLAVDANGNLWVWGSNRRGQLGIGTLIDSHVPTLVFFPVGTARTIVSIAAGTFHSLALGS